MAFFGVLFYFLPILLLPILLSRLLSLFFLLYPYSYPFTLSYPALIFWVFVYFFCRVFFCFYLCNNSFFLLSFFLSFCCSYRVLLVLSGVFILEIGVTGGPTGWCGPSSARPNQPNQLTGLTNQPTQSPYLPYYTTVLSGFSILISTLLCCDSALLHSTIFNHRNNAIITQQHTHTHTMTHNPQ